MASRLLCQYFAKILQRECHENGFVILCVECLNPVVSEKVAAPHLTVLLPFKLQILER